GTRSRGDGGKARGRSRRGPSLSPARCRRGRSGFPRRGRGSRTFSWFVRFGFGFVPAIRVREGGGEAVAVFEVEEGPCQNHHAEDDEGDDAVELVEPGEVEDEDLQD